jgi:hypothetical protein
MRESAQKQILPKTNDHFCSVSVPHQMADEPRPEFGISKSDIRATIYLPLAARERNVGQIEIRIEY